MPTVLVLYGTSHGQTAKIAKRIAARLHEQGVGAVLLDLKMHPRRAPLPSDVDGVIVCGRVHFGRHQSRLTKLVRQNHVLLQTVPSFFVSVSGAAGRTDLQSKGETAAQIQHLLSATGWEPLRAVPIGGAIPYTKYGPFLRWMIRRVSESNGGPTDTSRDWEFTDWNAVDRLAGEVTGFVRARESRRQRKAALEEAPLMAM